MSLSTDNRFAFIVVSFLGSEEMSADPYGFIPTAWKPFS